MDAATIILLNVGIATTLVAIVAAVMISPARLRRHFSHGYSHRQRSALHRHRGERYPDSAASTPRSTPTQVGRNG